MVLDRNGNQVVQRGGRDSLGNLPGGMTNMDMQQRVIGNTREDIEHKQHLAALQAQSHANFPRAMELNGVELPVYKFHELEDLGKKTLKQRCLDLRDLVEQSGCRFFENHAHLRLNAAVGEDVLLEWYVNVQVTIATALGMGLDHAAFGAPPSALPPPMPLSAQYLSTAAAYLMEDGLTITLWLGKDTPSEFLQQAFGWATLEGVDPTALRLLPPESSALAATIHALCELLRAHRGWMALQVVLQGNGDGPFSRGLIEDQTRQMMAYSEFIAHAHRYILSKVS